MRQINTDAAQIKLPAQLEPVVRMRYFPVMATARHGKSSIDIAETSA